MRGIIPDDSAIASCIRAWTDQVVAIAHAPQPRRIWELQQPGAER